MNYFANVQLFDVKFKYFLPFYFKSNRNARFDFGDEDNDDDDDEIIRSDHIQESLEHFRNPFLS